MIFGCVPKPRDPESHSKRGWKAFSTIPEVIAERRAQSSPAALQPLIRDIRVLEIKRMIERIKSADCQEFSAVYRARSPTRPKHRQRFEVFVFRSDRIVPEIKEAAPKASPSLSGFFAAASLIREEDL